jgi:hypothetical protein
MYVSSVVTVPQMSYTTNATKTVEVYMFMAKRVVWIWIVVMRRLANTEAGHCRYNPNRIPRPHMSALPLMAQKSSIFSVEVVELVWVRSSGRQGGERNLKAAKH